MATWFVSNTGSDSNAGTSYSAPFMTIGKALKTGSTVAAGETVWIEPGVYREQNVALAVQGSSGSPITVKGDVDGAGFRASGSTSPLTGEVRWTAWDNSDSSITGTAQPVTLNAKSYLTFQNLLLVGTKGSVNATIVLAAAGSTNIQFLDCVFLSDGNASSPRFVAYTGTADVAAHWLFDRCRFLIPAGHAGFTLTLPSSATASYDIDFVIRNCFVLGSSAAFLSTVNSGTATGFYPGGVILNGCAIWMPGNNILQTTSQMSTSIPCQLINSVCSGNLNANTSGQITEDRNYFYSVSRTNVTTGANSKAHTDQWAGVEIGQAEMWGRPARSFLMPSVGSLLLGFGNTSGPSTDGLGKPKPSGGQQTLWGNAAVANSLNPAIGYLERHDTAVKETTTTDAGSVGGRIDGPGTQEFRIAVDAVSTTISLKTRADTNYGTTNPPQVVLLANGEIGVATQTLTQTANTGTWNTNTFSAFTPTAKGVVTIRVMSNPAAANGICYFDTLAIS